MDQREHPATSADIMKAFSSLLTSRDREAQAVATRAEEAERARDAEIVEQAVGYTAEGIVKTLADLQLSFGAEVERLSGSLESESSKLGELKRARDVESSRLEWLGHVRLVAEALNVQAQRQDQERETAEATATAAMASLEDEQRRTRTHWEAEQTSFEARVSADDDEQAKARAQEEEAHAYEVRRQERAEDDAFATTKRDLERELSQTLASCEVEWAEREATLAQAKDELEALRTKAATFEAELEKAATDARSKAIREANEEAKIAAELSEKDFEGRRKVFELRIASLESSLERNNAQIDGLLAKLEVATNQSQALAVKAIEGSARG